MPQEIARQWFVSGEGIDRHVISADIQRYLGNDATVRPGLGTGENQGVQGFWIKAYRNLTSAMIADLRADSARWRQEQRQTGTRGSQSPKVYQPPGKTEPDFCVEPYVSSSTYQASSAGRTPTQLRRDADSPSLDGPYGLPPARERERIPVDTRMQIDPPQPSRGGGYQPDNRTSQYPPESRGFPSDARVYGPDGSRSQYPSDTAMSGFGAGRPPVSAPYGQEPRYAPSYPPQGNDSAPPGYMRQGNYYVPVSSYEPLSAMPIRADNYGGPEPYGQPQGLRDREPRDPRYQQPEFQDPRYAYPSPAATVSSVSARDRELMPSPQQPSNYGPLQPPQQFNQYNGSTLGPTPVQSTRPSGTNPNRQGGVGMFARPGGPGSNSSTRPSRR